MNSYERIMNELEDIVNDCQFIDNTAKEAQIEKQELLRNLKALIQKVMPKDC